MVPKAGLVVLDSNLFIDLRYPRDRQYRLNRTFLARLPALAPAATTLVNLLEVCGILSFNLTAQQVWELYHYLPEQYQVTVLPPPTLPLALPALPVEQLLTLVAKKLSTAFRKYDDAQFSSLSLDGRGKGEGGLKVPCRGSPSP